MHDYDVNNYFEEVTILGKPAMFTPLRVERNIVPHGYYAYDVRHDDECQGFAVELGRCIVVNHWGTLITNDEIKLDRNGHLIIEPGDLSYGTGDCRNMKDYMEKYPPKAKPPVEYER